MNNQAAGLLIRRARTAAGLTQTELADLMGTTQSVISRAESGAVLPSLAFLERVSAATGQPLTVELAPAGQNVTRAQRRARVRRATNNFVFDPWERDPSEAEARSLLVDGLTRDRFKRRASEDLYLDRLRQSTISPRETRVEFQSALAVAAARYEEMDWGYVRGRIAQILESDPTTGRLMKAHDSKIRRRARKSLTEPE